MSQSLAQINLISFKDIERRKECYSAFHKAVYAGEILRPERCQDCSRKCKVDGHHPNYDKPLAVEWLCRKCHAAAHLREPKKPGKNPNAELIEIMKRRELTQTLTAEICCCSRTTAWYWTLKPSDPRFQVIKPVYLRLLKLELGEAVPWYLGQRNR